MYFLRMMPAGCVPKSQIAKVVVNDFGVPRVYHHTAPISMAYALREALGILTEEGLEASWSRHRDAAEFFWNELEKIGLECHVDWEHRLPTLTTVKIPEGIDGGKVVTYLRENYSIEIAGGLGALAGKVWRIGLMGYNARRENAALVCAALRDALDAQGYYRAPGLLYPSRQHSRSSFHGVACFAPTRGYPVHILTIIVTHYESEQLPGERILSSRVLRRTPPHLIGLLILVVGPIEACGHRARNRAPARRTRRRRGKCCPRPRRWRDGRPLAI